MGVLQDAMITAGEALSEARKKHDPLYTRSRGPIIADRTRKTADLEREYGEKMRRAKSALAQAQQAFKSETYELREWRAHQLRAIGIETVSRLAPLLRERRMALEPFEKAYIAARKAYWESEEFRQ